MALRFIQRAGRFETNPPRGTSDPSKKIPRVSRDRPAFWTRLLITSPDDTKKIEPPPTSYGLLDGRDPELASLVQRHGDGYAASPGLTREETGRFWPRTSRRRSGSSASSWPSTGGGSGTASTNSGRGTRAGTNARRPPRRPLWTRPRPRRSRPPAGPPPRVIPAAAGRSSPFGRGR